MPHSIEKKSDSPAEAYITSRNQMLEERLNDPDRPLPKVILSSFVPDAISTDAGKPPIRLGNPNIPTKFFDIQLTDGTKIGGLALQEPDEAHRFIRTIKLYDSYLDQGYGRATYLEILKLLPEGVQLRTEGSLSHDSFKIWQRLVAEGLAERLDKDGIPRFETSI